jgi:hypothetical protein
VVVEPGSELALTIYVSDFRISFYDRFSLEQNPVVEAGAANTSELGRFTNTIGASVLWDLNEMVVGLGYDHTDAISTSEPTAPENGRTQGDFSLSDYAQDAVHASVTFAPVPEIAWGFRGVTSQTTYTQGGRPDTIAYSASLFIDARMSRYTSMEAEVGYRVFEFGKAEQDEFETAFARNSPKGSADFFGQLRIQNRLNRFYSQSLAFGRESESGATSAILQTDFLRYSSALTLNHRMSLGIEAFYETGSQQGLAETEAFSRSGLGLRLSLFLSRRLTTAAFYRFTSRESDLAARSYVQNLIGLQFGYAF